MHVAGNAYYGRYIRTAGLSASIRDEKSWCVSIGFSTAHGDTPIPDSSPVVWYLYLPIWNTVTNTSESNQGENYANPLLNLTITYSSSVSLVYARITATPAGHSGCCLGQPQILYSRWHKFWVFGMKGNEVENLPKQPPAKNISRLSPSHISYHVLVMSLSCFFFTANDDGGRSYIKLLQKINSW